MRYGHDRTIHRTEHLDVETDSDGYVVAVWFRCMMLPFKQTRVRYARAQEMRAANDSLRCALLAVEVSD